MTKIEYAIEDLENISNMSGYEMLRNDNDILIRKTAENAVELLKEQQAEIDSFKAEQHPRKVKNMRDLADLTVGECPSCGEYIDNETCPNFCGWCGDRIDWSNGGEHE